MIKRLGVASMGVAGLAYVSNPLSVMVGFLILVGGPVCWSTWVAYTGQQKLRPGDNEAE